MSFIGALFALAKDFPAFVSLFMEIKQMIDQYTSQEKKQAAIKTLEDGINAARQSKDTSKLTDSVNSILSGVHS